MKPIPDVAVVSLFFSEIIKAIVGNTKKCHYITVIIFDYLEERFMKKKFTIQNFKQSLIVATLCFLIFNLFESKKEINWVLMAIMFVIFFLITFFSRSFYSYFSEEREQKLKRKNKFN